MKNYLLVDYTLILGTVIRVVEGVFGHRAWRQIEVNGMRFGSVKGGGATGVVSVSYTHLTLPTILRV